MRGARAYACCMRQRARVYAGKHPILFYSLYRSLRSESRARWVDRKTQVVIEGYPRSGNTFAVVAFQQAQRESVRIAHHLHAPAQVMRAERLQIPAIVLIREPADAALSQMVRRPNISASLALKSYISFYETVASHCSNYVIGTFREVTNDYGSIIERANVKFGTRFIPFQHTDANLKEVFAIIDYLNKINGKGLDNKVSRPSVAKDRLKDEAKSMLATKETAALLAAAQAMYYDFASQAGR